uniref:Uncharacterized protein n=1 Tax=Arundo donax TaxID=35708 RepID=A0A0A9CFN7_ARUDO
MNWLLNLQTPIILSLQILIIPTRNNMMKKIFEEEFMMR